MLVSAKGTKRFFVLYTIVKSQFALLCQVAVVQLMILHCKILLPVIRLGYPHK
jgi:hypothetical protein